MTALEALFGGRESRANLDNPSVALTAGSLLDFIYSGSGTGPGLDAGVVVTEATSMHMASVWRCVSVISGVASALPMNVFEAGTKTKVRNSLLRDPHPELTPLELWKLTYVHRCLWGNGYVQKVRNGAGVVTELWPISPWRVQVGRVKPSDANPGGKIFKVLDDTGATEPYTTRTILHLPGLGYDGVSGLSPIRHAATTIGLAQAAEKSGARFFARGAQLSGVLQVEQRLAQGDAEKLQTRWESKMAGVEHAGKIAVLDSGAKFQPITMPLRDAQYLETRAFQVPEIARIFGVPLFLLFEAHKVTSWGTGLEQQAQGWVTFDLHPSWLAPTEQRITKELLATSREARYDVNGLLRGDSAARAAFYQVMRAIGAYSANDVRDKEDEPPIGGGDDYTPLGLSGQAPPNQTQPPPEPPDPNGGGNAGN